MLNRWKSALNSLQQEIKLYQWVLRDSRTPKSAKFLLGLAIGYALTPIDLIPDFIPVLGHLDDAIIIPALAFFALKLVPKEIIRDCRSKLTQP